MSYGNYTIKIGDDDEGQQCSNFIVNEPMKLIYLADMGHYLMGTLSFEDIADVKIIGLETLTDEKTENPMGE